MEEHENVIKEIKKKIKKVYPKARIFENYEYLFEGNYFYIDLLISIDFTLFIFEIKTGSKEKKARKQLDFHKKAISILQKDLSIRDILFSKIQTLWVSVKESKIVNTETNKEIYYDNFLANPIFF